MEKKLGRDDDDKDVTKNLGEDGNDNELEKKKEKKKKKKKKEKKKKESWVKMMIKGSRKEPMMWRRR